MENSDLVFQETVDSQSRTHSRPTKCDRQAIQARPDHSDRIIPPPNGLTFDLLLVASASSGPVCHQAQQQTALICITTARPPGMDSGCTQPALGRSEPLCLPTGSHLWQNGGELQDYPC